MQFSAAALLTLATAASAMQQNYQNTTTAANSTTVSYKTVTTDVYTTVCPASATLTYGTHTYVNTLQVESTITLPCPCTLVTPVYYTSTVACHTCPATSVAVVVPNKSATLIVPGAQVPATQVPGAQVPGAQVPSVQVPGAQAPGVQSTPSVPGAVNTAPSVPGSTYQTAGASTNALALSGASLAGLLAVAAYIL